MKQDEFNQYTVTNDKQLLKAEFGKTQPTEFSDAGKMHLHRSAYNGNLNQNLQNSSHETFAEVGTSSTASVASSEGTVVIGSSATASTIAAGSASAIVVASSVAITALSVATGVSIALHDYKCDMNSLFISSNQVTCELTINDLNADKNDNKFDNELQTYDEEPCSIRVYNKYYDSSKKLHLGFNDITFDNLTLGQTYNIVVTADSVSGGKTIYDKTFTTAEVTNFLDFSISPNFDSYNNVVYVSLDFVDELNQLSDFALTITRIEELSPIEPYSGLVAEEIDLEPIEEDRFSATYQLEKKVGTQEVHIEEQDMWIEPDMPYQYEFSYMRKGQKISYKHDEIRFVDIHSAIAEVYGVNFNNEANYQEGTFVLNLIYNDENNVLSNFVLHLSRDDGYNVDIPLMTTNQPQTIDANRYELDLESQYNATLTYLNNGVEETKVLQPFSFADNSGPRSVFNDFIFTGYADFVEKTFDVRIDYQDDLKIFHDFVLTISDDYGDFNFEYALQETNTTQTVSATELVYEEGVEYNYSLKCQKDGVETTLYTDTVQLRDVYGRTTQFNGLTVFEAADFDSNVFNVQLNYVDTFDAYKNFVLTFSKPTAVSADSYEFRLSKTTDIQQLDGGAVGMSLLDGTFNYTLTVDNAGYPESLVSSSVTFVDSEGRSSIFNSLIFDGTANKLTDEIAFTLDFTDDFGLYSDFKITFHDNDLDYDTEIELAKTTEEQSFPLMEYDLAFDTSYTYTLTALYKGVLTVLQSDTFILSDNSGAISEVYAPSISSTANYRTRTFQITLNYQDDFGYFDDFVMTVRDTETDIETIVNLNKTTEPQSVSFNDQRINEDTGETEYDIDIIDHVVVYTLTYYDSSVNLTHELVKDESLPAFANSLNTEFYGLVSSWKLVPDQNYADHYYLPMKLNYIDEKGIYGYMEINMYIDQDVVGHIEFQNEVVPEKGEWISGSVSTELSLSELTSNPITFKVEGQLLSEKDPNVTEDYSYPMCTETHTLSLADEAEVYAVTTDGGVYGGQVSFEAFFAGSTSEFANAQIIIETANHTYTYDVTLTGCGDYITVTLDEPNEGMIDSDVYNEEFGQPVTIKFSYCTITTVNSSDGPSTEVFSDPIVLVCYTNYLFTISV